MTRAILAVWMLTIACTREDVVADLQPNPAARDAGTPDAADAGTTTPDRCDTSGPPLIVGDTGETTCGSAVAERTFRFALCTCTDLVTSNALTTDAFDSADGPYTAGGAGGAIGINGGANLNAPLIAGGSLWIGGASGLTAAAAAPIDTGGDLQLGGPLASEARVAVAGDARIAGRVSAPALAVGGTLSVPPNAAIDVADQSMIAAIAREPVAVALPCTCDQDELLDIAAYVARHRSDNDNAAAGISPDILSQIPTATTVELPCGRYYFSRISANAELTLKITGRTSVMVDGDLSIDTGLRVLIDDGAEIDLFVAGNIVSAGPIDFGSARSPSRARLYSGGTGTLQISGGGVFAGNLYAPRAELVASAPIEVFGSIFVRRMAASAQVIVHYDRAVLRAGDDCEAPPPVSCTSCSDCANVACTGGQCTACATNTDCCPPLYCVSGRCEASPF